MGKKSIEIVFGMFSILKKITFSINHLSSMFKSAGIFLSFIMLVPNNNYLLCKWTNHSSLTSQYSFSCLCLQTKKTVRLAISLRISLSSNGHFSIFIFAFLIHFSPTEITAYQSHNSALSRSDLFQCWFITLIWNEKGFVI